MSKYFTIVLIVSAGIIVAFTICLPEFLAFNDFLVSFVNHEILNILAVMSTVTIASAANIHLAFNRLEEKAGKTGAFASARREISGSAITLVFLFIFTVLVLIIKAISLGVYWLSFWNGVCLLILLINVFVLIDITSAVFEVTPYQDGSAD